MFTTKHRRGRIVFPCWKEGKNGVLFNEPTLHMTEETIADAALSDCGVTGKESRRVTAQKTRNKLLNGTDPRLSSEVKIIFSCLWLEGFTLTLNCSSSCLAPLPALSGLIKCQECPWNQKHTLSSSPPQQPPIPNSFRLLWLRAGGLTQSHSSTCTVCRSLPLL